MKLKDVPQIRPGSLVKVTGHGFMVVGRLQYTEYDLNEEYIEDWALCEEEPTRHLVSREPTVRLTVGHWESPEFDLYDDTIEIAIEVEQ